MNAAYRTELQNDDIYDDNDITRNTIFSFAVGFTWYILA